MLGYWDTRPPASIKSTANIIPTRRRTIKRRMINANLRNLFACCICFCAFAAACSSTAPIVPVPSAVDMWH